MLVSLKFPYLASPLTIVLTVACCMICMVTGAIRLPSGWHSFINDNQ